MYNVNGSMHLKRGVRPHVFNRFTWLCSIEVFSRNANSSLLIGVDIISMLPSMCCHSIVREGGPYSSITSSTLLRSIGASLAVSRGSICSTYVCIGTFVPHGGSARPAFSLALVSAAPSMTVTNLCPSTSSRNRTHASTTHFRGNLRVS